MKDLLKGHYAHRGLFSKDQSIPENSMKAFEKAVKAGYGIELDVNLTKDGYIVVFHDDSLKRACGLDRKLTDCTWEDIKDLPLFGTQETIPLFSQVLELVKGQVPLIVELKGSGAYLELAQKVNVLLGAYDQPYCIESFHPMVVKWFKKHAPATIRGQLSAGYGDFMDQKPYERWVLSQLFTNSITRPDFVAYKHQDASFHPGLGLYRILGGALIAYTVTDQDDHSKLESFFDAVIFEHYLP